MVVTEFAPAKINLYLHVLGRRADGYHDLDSLVVFARKGSPACDWVEMAEAASYSLRIEGPEASGLQQEDPEKNLVTKALRALSAKTGKPLNLSLRLHKQLPIAAGIGGGSADAAAALRAAAQIWGLDIQHPAMAEAARAAGEDGYSCLLSAPCYFEGTGQQVSLSDPLPQFWMVLVNPHIPVPTADVFRARQGAFNQPARLAYAPATVDELADMLQQRTNDLQAAACGLVEAIEHTLDMLESQKGCLLSRMSGSGGTCFGIFADETAAQNAAGHIRRQIGEYWIAVTPVG